MRVALHVDQLRAPVPGGIATYVRGLLGALPAAGVDLATFGTGLPGDGLPDDIVAAYEDLGLPGPPVRYLLWHRARRPRVRIAGTDVVHTPSLAVPPTGATPLVATVHDVAFLRIPHSFTRHGVRFHRRGLKLARKHAGAIVVPSEFTRTELLREDFDPERVFVAPHGAPVVRAERIPGDEALDAALEEALGRLGIRRPFVVAVGTIEPRKGFDVVARAFAELRLRGVQLVIAGQRGWGHVVIPDDVVTLGGVNTTTRDALYRAAAACVVPSQYEGFGFPALEAMANGTPVIAADATSLPEVVGRAGVLVPFDDVDAWASAVAGVVGDLERAQRLGEAGRERAATFTWARSATAHLEAYRHAMEG